jgi:hypothetical protein
VIQDLNWGLRNNTDLLPWRRHMRTSHVLLLPSLLLGGDLTWADEDVSDFIDNTELQILNRTFYIDNRTHNKDPAADRNRELTQGFIARLRSGFTPGLIGLGVDAHSFLGLRLDSSGPNGTGLLPRDGEGRPENEYGGGGGAIKARWGSHLLQIGEMEVATPVFDTGDKRLQPEFATGTLLQGSLSDSWQYSAGRFTAFKNQAQSTRQGDFEGYGVSTRKKAVTLLGAQTTPGNALGAAFYVGELSDVWRQYYGNMNAAMPLGDNASLSFDANLYRELGIGGEQAGPISVTATSLMTQLAVGSHSMSLGLQKIDGKTPFDYVGGDSIYLANAIKYADFNGPNERSWQLRYDYNASQTLAPGLSFMGRYVSGSGIDGTHAPRGGAYNSFNQEDNVYTPAQGKNGRHWERDLQVRYVVQGGVAKNLSTTLSYVTHRANSAQAGADIDRIYFVMEYPLDLLGGH